MTDELFCAKCRRAVVLAEAVVGQEGLIHRRCPKDQPPASAENEARPDSARPGERTADN